MIPFFSIVIPAYNRASFLEETINSVLQQDCDDFEIVLVDDGSTDSTKDFVRKIYSRVSKVKYFYKDNSERGAARNYGIKLSRGRYIVFLDSDDVMLRDYLSTLHNYIAKMPDVYLFATKYSFQNNNKVIKHRDLESLNEKLYGVELVLKGNPLACNFCIKNDQEEFSLFIEDRQLSIMEDWLFLLQNLQKFNLYLIDKVTLQMKDHDGRSMRKSYLQVIEKRLNALSWIEEHLSLASNDMRKIRAFSYYFCSIHYFIGGKKKEAKKFLFKAVQEAGWNKSFLKHYVKVNMFRINANSTI